MRRILLLALVLSGCEQAPSQAVADSAGARLEEAAETAGIVPDPNAPLQGSWARDTDRVCVVGTAKTARIGVSTIMARTSHAQAREPSNGLAMR